MQRDSGICARASLSECTSCAEAARRVWDRRAFIAYRRVLVIVQGRVAYGIDGHESSTGRVVGFLSPLRRQRGENIPYGRTPPSVKPGKAGCRQGFWQCFEQSV